MIRRLPPNSMKQLSLGIIKTLCYSEVFSYPLSFQEVWKYLMYSKKTTREELLAELRENKDIFEHKDGYFFLKGNSRLVAQRLLRAEYARKKLIKATTIVRILSRIPTIKLIGVSGSLAMNNTKKDDDIDLFFITSANTVWISRLLVLLMLIVLREKRSRQHALGKDMICPNMFLSESALAVTAGSRNMYTAHEVSQLKVLYAKDNMYQKFLSANTWVFSFLPHAFSPVEKTFVSHNLLTTIFIPVEYVLFIVQFLYMKKRITNEKISLLFAMFHPLKNDVTIEAIYALKVQYWKAIFRHKLGRKNRHNLASVN